MSRLHYEHHDHLPMGYVVASPPLSPSSSAGEARVNRRSGGGLFRWNACDGSMVWIAENVFCLSFFVLLWLYAAATIVMLSSEGPTDVVFGPSSSFLVDPKPNPIFVKSLKVKVVDESRSGVQLFGFYRSPPLDVVVNWSESRLAFLSHKSYTAWPYYLNKGASLNISYRVKPEGRSVQLVVGRGEASDSLLDETRHKNIAPSWNMIQGSGMTEVKISSTSMHYVAVVNSIRNVVEVELDFNVSSVMYDTKQAFYKCTLNNSECTFDIRSLFGNNVVLTSPLPVKGVSSEEDKWYVNFSYQPRWSAYIIGTVLVTCVMGVVIHLSKLFHHRRGERYVAGNDSTWSTQGTQTPLLEDKDEDSSSMTSSGESFAADDDCLEDVKGEANTGTRGICAICMNSPRDCFFLPCGHCASCYECGIKVVETSGGCPICRKKIKKVNPIYTA